MEKQKVYRLNQWTCQIEQVEKEAAAADLAGFGYTPERIEKLFDSATDHLYTPDYYYCPFKSPLIALLIALAPTAPAPYGTKEVRQIVFDGAVYL